MKKWLCCLLACLMLLNSIPVIGLSEGTVPAEEELTETIEVTPEPTAEPTAAPTAEPTAAPTAEPTAEAVAEPTAEPEAEPTAEPTAEPVAEPAEDTTPEMTELPEAEATEAPAGGKNDVKEDSEAEVKKLEGKLISGYPIQLQAETEATEAPAGRKNDVKEDSEAEVKKLEGKLISGYPTQLQVKAHATLPSTAVTLTWVPSADTGLTGYQIQSSYTATFDSVFTKTVSASVTTYDYTGLTMGQTRFYRIRSYRTIGSDTEYSSFSNIVEFTPGPIAPDGTFVATPLSGTGVKLSWTWASSQNVSGYLIYRYDYSTSSEALIGSVRNQLYYDDNTLTLGAKYRYRVYSFYIKNGEQSVSSNYREIDEYIALPPFPEEIEVKSAGISSLSLTWKAVNGAIGYRIYRSADLGANYSELATVTTTSYLDNKNIVSGQKYFYQIATLVTGNVEGNRSAAVEGVAGPSAPTNFTAKYVSSTAIKLEWTAVEDVAGYDIWVSDNNVSFTQLAQGTMESHTYTDEGLSVGQGRWYYIRSYVGNGSSKVYSARTDIVFEITRPLAVKDFELDIPVGTYNQIELSWTASAGAAGYDIERSLNGSSFSPIMTDYGSTTWVNTALSCGATYYYRVRPYVMSGSKKYFGGYSEIKSMMAKPSITTSLSGVQNATEATAVDLTWAQIYGANGYSVYYKETDGSTHYAGGTNQKSKTTFTVKNLTLGQTYTFIVRGYRLVNNVKVLGLPTHYDMKLNVPQVVNLSKTPIDIHTVTVKWDEVKSAAGYELTVNCSKDSNYTNKKVMAATNSYTFNDLIIGYDYDVTVRAYIGEEPNYEYGPASTLFTFYSSPETPKNYAAKMLIGSWNVQITWNKVEGASGYEILRSLTKASGYSVIADVNDGSATKYLDPMTASDAGITYYYKIRSYVTTGFQRRSNNTYGMEVKVIPPRPTMKLSQVDSAKVHLEWTAVAGTTSYYVYRATAYDGPYTLLKKVSSTSTDCGNLTTGVRYYFKVASVVVDGSGNEIRGVMSSAQSVLATAVAPTITKVMAYAKSVKVEWSVSPEATSYTVYYALQGGEFVKAGTTTDTKFTVTKLLCNTPYQFRVTASIGNAEGLPSTIATITTFVRTPTGLTAQSTNANAMKLSWKTVINATGYEIQYTEVASPTDADYEKNRIFLEGVTEKEISGLIVSANYHYRVRAYADTRANYGGWAYVTAQTKALAATELRVNNKTATTISLKWKGAYLAAGYIVMYRKTTDASYSTAATIEGPGLTTYLLSGLSAGTGYYIKLQSFTRDPNGTMVLGTTSKYIYGKTE